MGEMDDADDMPNHDELAVMPKRSCRPEQRCQRDILANVDIVEQDGIMWEATALEGVKGPYSHTFGHSADVKASLEKVQCSYERTFGWTGPGKPDG